MEHARPGPAHFLRGCPCTVPATACPHNTVTLHALAERQSIGKKMAQVKALIFDFNGVILDDEPIHNRNVQRVFSEEGIVLSLEEIRRRCHGRGDFECLTLLLREAGREPVDSLVASSTESVGDWGQRQIAKRMI